MRTRVSIMATQRQLRANRQNALKSTGPRTLEGKAVSRRNAMRHGLSARHLVLAGEDPTLLEALRRELVVEFAPVSATQQALVELLAGLLWRLRRAQSYEAALMSWIGHQQGQMYDGNAVTLGDVVLVPHARGVGGENGDAALPRPADAMRKRGRMLEAILDRRDMLSKLGRYEAHLARQAIGVIRQLKT